MRAILGDLFDEIVDLTAILDLVPPVKNGAPVIFSSRCSDKDATDASNWEELMDEHQRKSIRHGFDVWSQWRRMR
ncbi:MAG: hypothetical protein CMO55_12960 [Verrucomicrobiales bacterium]|nr:hypothetical protein [Verrucomicrobiales bacterium]